LDLDHGSLTLFSILLNALPFIAAALITGNPGGGPAVLFTVLQFIQWFVIAYGVSALFSRAGRRVRRTH